MLRAVAFVIKIHDLMKAGTITSTPKKIHHRELNLSYRSIEAHRYYIENGRFPWDD